MLATSQTSHRQVIEFAMQVGVLGIEAHSCPPFPTHKGLQSKNDNTLIIRLTRSLF